MVDLHFILAHLAPHPKQQQQEKSAVMNSETPRARRTNIIHYIFTIFHKTEKHLFKM